MARFSEHAGRLRYSRFRRPRPVVAWMLMAAIVSFSGCGGCDKTPEQIEQEKKLAEEKEKEKEKKKKEEEVKPFEAGMPRALPTSSLFSGMCKRGHWICQSWPDVKSNLSDFQGELQTEVVDISNHRVPLNDVPYEMTSQRPAALAKKQQKTLESFSWVPSRYDSQRGNLSSIPRSINVRMTSPGGGATAIEQSLILTPMPSYEYFFVVLSKGSRFDYLNKKLDCIRLHRQRAESGREPKFYEVVTIAPGKRPGLPSNSLYWTSIAYLLWDESDPALWDIDQQQALIDWLHWGGQIIVSGPDALNQLQSSFLRPYLPATVEKSRTFTAEDLAPLQYWAGAYGRPPKLVQPWPGAVLKKDANAESLANTPTDTVIERRVGRGRIVVSAFRITGPDFTGWEGCDSFFNACLMRRPARKFYLERPSDDLRIDWLSKDMVSETVASSVQKGTANLTVDPAPDGEGTIAPVTPDGTDPAQPAVAGATGPQTVGGAPVPGRSVTAVANARQSFLDARKCTSLRYFSRDAGQRRDSYAADVALARTAGIDQGQNPYYNTNGLGTPGYDTTGNDDDEFDAPEPDKTSAGMCAWSDFSPVAQAAREGLDNATGITVPERGFIVWMVVGYLCVLVPLNWLLFRLIGRVEWAWISAPLIAIGCTVVVVRQAQLNIGFARSRNEIAVVEMQPGYTRAHKTYYTALYSSLATTYDLHLADPGGQILPFPTGSKRKLGFAASNGEVVCRRGDDTELTGFHVASNTKDYVHGEEMADFGGVVSLHYDTDGGLRVTNGTKHPLENGRVVWIEDRTGSAKLFTLGRLDPGTTARLKDSKPFNRTTAAETARGIVTTLDNRYSPSEVQYPNGNTQPTNIPNPTGELSAELVQVALGLQDMRPGEVCLVARIADEVSGLTVTPETRQYRQAALLVAHLDPGKLPDPERDERSGVKSFSNPAPLPDSPQSTIPELDPSAP